ncbi:hypothetical protein Y032_0113g375 [Ancylostoma ceylanicum]|uniref:Saposin B-type domain-containing protein n=1 Tax=Ancylostoma ceylanicum TaxID=53326 RepID=A0A016TCP3_9BILA|nr:hypothetical protein Y032_0113g375 [Ancylostoma ceylanicum]
MRTILLVVLVGIGLFVSVTAINRRTRCKTCMFVLMTLKVAQNSGYTKSKQKDYICTWLEDNWKDPEAARMCRELSDEVIWSDKYDYILTSDRNEALESCQQEFGDREYCYGFYFP